MTGQAKQSFALQCAGVGRHFGNRPVLRNVNIEIEAGAKVALMGANGSGKTTLLRIAAGVLRPTAGSVATASLAYCPQDAPVYPELTAAEHLKWACKMHGAPANIEALGNLATRRAGELSRGQRQRLHLEMAFQSGASLLLLDEPFAPLDDAAAAWLEARINQYDGAVLFSAHDQKQAAAASTHFIDVDNATPEVTPW